MGLGAPKQALGPSGGVSRERVRALEGSRGGPERKKRDFGAIVVFPETLQSLYLLGFQRFFEKTRFFQIWL